MKYFQNCKNLDEVKQLFKKLALANHPDRGGDVKIMQEINNEYSFVIARISKNAGFTAEESESEIRLSQEYQDAINAIAGIEDITIELVGSWIWVTGNTRLHKDRLKAAGFYWASKKFAWYYRSEDKKTRTNSKLSLDEIKCKYGSEKLNPIKYQSIS